MAELIDKDGLLKKQVTIPGPSGKSVYSVVFTDDILNAKSIEPTTQEPKWIPTSERLPEEDGEYLVTVYDTDENYKYRDIAELENGIWQYKDYVKVLAWMPLPPCYEPQESEG